MTIKDAVIQVLNSEHRLMTANEIYEKIVENSLYSFGAQNPVNVVRTTIEYACENSGYSSRDSIPYFRFECNSDGRRVYQLLTMSAANAQLDINDNENIAEVISLKSNDVVIWNRVIEQSFQKWMERGHYSQRTADNYRRAVAQIYRNYNELAQCAISDANTAVDAIKKWISILNDNDMFLAQNSTRHNQFTAALAALEQFQESDNTDYFDSSIIALEKLASSKILPSLSNLGDIIDFEEGKSGIRHILKTHFQNLYGYSNIDILWDAAQNEIPMFLNDNAINTAADLWQFVLRVFGHEYILSNPHIWQINPIYPQNVCGLVVNLARQFGGIVTREQINDYFARIQIVPPKNQALVSHDELLFYDNNRFIAAEIININTERIEAISAVLSSLFNNENTLFIVPRDIQSEWFTRLPKLSDSISWTPLLLQEVLRTWPNIGFRVIRPNVKGQAYDTLGAAIVPNNSEITKFADVVHSYCAAMYKLPNSMATEDLRIELRSAGMLEGNELIYNLHKALIDYRFAFNLENTTVRVLEN